MFENALRENVSHIAAIEDRGQIVGFCKVDLCGEKGKLDYLVVLKEYRGNGYGKALMDWAMESFAEYGVHQMEVKVVAGNKAIHLYEKYGFRSMRIFL